MKNIILFFTLLCFIPQINAQKINLEPFEKIKPRSIGPAGMSGRITTIDVDLSQPERIFVGTASGGVWQSENGGISWKPIFDDHAPASIGALTINQNNPAEIWLGTGEGNPRNSHNYGEGIYRSIDGGKTWECMGLENTRLIHRIIIHKDDPNIIYVGAMGSAWGDSKDRGFYKTTDGGKTWRKTLYINESTGIGDLVVDPNNPNKLIAAMWEFGRKPWTFNSGGKGSGLYVSYDGGENWKERTDKDGLPKGELGRIGLAVAPSEPNIIYALTEAKKNVLLKSTDGGDKWTQVADKNIGNRPFYYSDIFVDPLNENRIFNLWSVVSKSEDGGKTFETILPFQPYSGVHPDHHAFWVHPTQPDYMIEGNDGGLNISRDRGKTWRFVENLPLAQFYHINYDMEVPYNIYGGMQDNGSWRGPAYVWKSGGIINQDWQELYFGDGFDVMARPDDARYVYAMSQGGNMSYLDTETGQRSYIKPVHPKGIKLRFHWNAGLAQDPFENCGVYFGSQFLHKSTNCGQSWEIISPDLTTNDTLKQKQYESGGLTIDDTNAENHTTIIAIAPSSVDKNVIWVGTDDGNLQVTRDGGKTWSNTASRLTGARANSWIPQIIASEKNAGEAYVIVNDYRRNDFRPMAYHTTDYGTTYRRIVDENKVEGHALAIAQDPEVPNLLWLGTEYGLYFTIDGGTNWNKYTHGYPQAPTRDLKIHPREKDLVIGTYGRAAYVLDDTRPFQKIAETKGKVLEQDFATFPAPDAYLNYNLSVKGARFVADGTFVGDNRRNGSMLTVWVKPEADEKASSPVEISKKKKKKLKGEAEATPEKEEKKAAKKDKLKLAIINMAGDTVRMYKTKVDTGMQRIYWNLRKDGVRSPSRREVKKDADLPSGRKVRPGKYKIVMTYGDSKDSTEVNVLADPRVTQSTSDLEAEIKTRDDFEENIRRATEGFNRIMEAKKTVKLVNSTLVNIPDSTQTQIKDLGKVVTDSLKTLEYLFLSPENQKGIRRNDTALMSSVWRTYSYLSSSGGAPNPTAEIVIQQSEEKINEALEKVNAFFDKDWKAYREKVEAVERPLFKE
jgi:photosystem II stability/assembly factor-like uncharacterized protein